MSYKIKNWQRFQHYKNKEQGARLVWIKLYRDLLDDQEWFSLSGDSRAGLVMLWLIASDFDGVLPNHKQLAFRLRISEKNVNDLLSTLSHWLERDDSNALEQVYIDSRQDKIREDKINTTTRLTPSFTKPTPEELHLYLKERNSPVDAEAFLAFYESNGWRVGRNPMKSWKAAVITWEKSDFKKPKSKAEEIKPWA